MLAILIEFMIDMISSVVLLAAYHSHLLQVCLPPHRQEHRKRKWMPSSCWSLMLSSCLTQRQLRTA